MLINKICFLVADLRAVGPTRQTLNIIKYSGVKENCVVLTLFEEPDETLIDEYRKEEIPVECLCLNRKLFFFNGISKIVSFCKEKSISVIHSYGVKPDIIGHLAAKKAGIKHIITLRNFPKEDLTGRMTPWVGKIIAQFHLFVLKRCKYLIACSKTIADKMAAAYGVNITPIQNGVDTSLFTMGSHDSRKEFCAEFGANDASKIFICTNSFIPRKHNDEIAQAFVAADMKNAELFFLGDGPLLDPIKKQYSNVSGIHFMGKRADVVRFLQNSDVFISASDSEGLPNAVLEALACGCSVLLSDIPQHYEILESLPQCGKVFELHDITALTGLIKSMRESESSQLEISESLMGSPLTMEKMGYVYGEYYKQNGVEC